MGRGRFGVEGGGLMYANEAVVGEFLAEYRALEARLADPALRADSGELRRVCERLGELGPAMGVYT